MIALSMNSFHGDSSAGVLKDGKLIAAAEEERFARIKHWAGVPLKALQYCLGSAEATLGDVDYIVLSKNPFAHVAEKICAAVQESPPKTLKRVNANIGILSIKAYLREYFSYKNKIKARIVYVEHHKAHIAHGYYASPFKNSLILSCDGTGDMRTTMWGVARGNRIDIKGGIRFPHSLGFLYTAFTQFLGFPEYGDEYKVMGLAPYGKPVFKKEIQRIVKVKADGSFRLDTSYFDINKGRASMTWMNCRPRIGRLYSDKVIKFFGEPRKPRAPIDERHKDIACSLQLVLEEAVLNLLTKLKSRYEEENLCLTGGVSANSVLCGKISSLRLFNNVYVPPAPGDAGTAIGALAYFYYKKRGKRPEGMHSAFKGPSYTREEIKRAIEASPLKYEELPEDRMLDFTVKALMDKKIVGWFQGAMEFGYRALGARSILTHPGPAGMKDILNNRIKHRESFRPFAPSVMEEYASEFFYANDKSPYMSFVAKVKEDKADKIKAVVHVDNTARVQTVSKDENPLYHRLLERFYQRTGLPLVLNTSFNENEPIVNSPKEAIDCFLRTRMDVLIMNNFVVKR
jgi:carbamoyltransferase